MQEQHEVVVLLRQCIQSKNEQKGAALHAAIAQTDLIRVKLVQDLLVQMYAKCGRVDIAAKVFDAMEHPNCTSYNIMAAAYASNGRLEQAKATFLRNPAKDTVSWNTLIAAMARAGQLVEACQLLAQMPTRDVVSWNSIICACGRSGRALQALDLLERMERDEVAPNLVTYLGITDSCARLRDPSLCNSIYTRIVATSSEIDVKLGNALVHMFGRCRNVSQAQAAFDRLAHPDTVSWNVLMTAYAENGDLGKARAIFTKEMPPAKKSVVSWNVIISAFARGGLASEALEFFHAMKKKGFDADDVTFLAALDACCALKDVERGKRIHSIIILSSRPSLKVGNSLISMYGKCGSPCAAWGTFRGLETRDLVSWNAMMAAFAQNGRVGEAWQLFDRMPCRDVIAWNTMIAALAHNGLPGEALILFDSMEGKMAPAPNSVTFLSALDACAHLAAISRGRKLHQHITEAGGLEMDLQNSLINMYGKCGSVTEAQRVYDDMKYRDIVSWNSLLAAYSLCGRTLEADLLFDKVPERDTITWNVMITCKTRNGDSRGALLLFALMVVEAVEADDVTFIAALDACSDLVAFATGREIHDSVCRTSIRVWNALINFYGRCKRSDEARSTFDRMKERDLISWTAMMGAYSLAGSVNDAKACFEVMPEHDIAAWNAIITTYIQNGYRPEALETFKLMQLRGIDANDITLTSVPEACTSSPEDAKFVYERTVSSGIRSVLIDNALLKMLGSCCSVPQGRQLFEQMHERNVVTWNFMVMIYAHRDHILEASDIVTQMSLEGEMPNVITFLMLLSRYSHEGRLVDAVIHFLKMQHEFWIQPDTAHFCCMVDVLARLGRLAESEQLLINMLKPDVQTWLALTGGCNMHGNVERGVAAAQQAWKLKPFCSAPYILASNLYKVHS